MHFLEIETDADGFVILNVDNIEKISAATDEEGEGTSLISTKNSDVEFEIKEEFGNLSDRLAALLMTTSGLSQVSK